MNYIGNDYFMGELLKKARKTGLNRLEVDILNNEAEPKELPRESIQLYDYHNR
jgi:hypothetical protein